MYYRITLVSDHAAAYTQQQGKTELVSEEIHAWIWPCYLLNVCLAHINYEVAEISSFNYWNVSLPNIMIKDKYLNYSYKKT